MEHILKKFNELKQLAVDAGKIILDIYDNTDFNVEYKSDNSPLTIADQKSNDFIVKHIKQWFPEHAVLAEESKDNPDRLNNDWCWVIDPLDGTKEFVKRNGEFTVNIGLAYKQKSVLGIIYIPVTDELYYAAVNYGSFYKKNDKILKLKVSDKTDNLILTKSRSHASEKYQDLIDKNQYRIKKVISTGSSLKGCLIAKGEADIYYRFNPTKEWDTCAMQCVVEQAGGIMKQMDNTELIYNRKDIINRKGFFILNKPENQMLNYSK
jgi:3'(2'), 5'-bisphosphate nucleotidase